MAEEIVEQIRLDQVVELVAPAHPHRHGKAPFGEVREEVRLGDQPRHADHFETGQALQPLARFFQHGDAMRVGA